MKRLLICLTTLIHEGRGIHPPLTPFRSAGLQNRWIVPAEGRLPPAGRVFLVEKMNMVLSNMKLPVKIAMSNEFSIIRREKGFLKYVYKAFKKYDTLKKGDNVVFDIDGTLLDGKSPLHSMVKLYKELDKRGCNMYLITARTIYCEEDTIKQLKKHEINYKKLIMFPGDIMMRSRPHAIKFFKQGFRNAIPDIKLTVGDRWDDLEFYKKYLDDIWEIKFVCAVVGEKFIKL